MLATARSLPNVCRRCRLHRGPHRLGYRHQLRHRSLVTMFGDDLGKAKLVSISPVTSQTLRELGHVPAAEAKECTMPGIVQAILGMVNAE